MRRLGKPMRILPFLLVLLGVALAGCTASFEQQVQSASTSGDTDGDGTPDASDLDDDNDGIPDSEDSTPVGSRNETS